MWTLLGFLELRWVRNWFRAKSLVIGFHGQICKKIIGQKQIGVNWAKSLSKVMKQLSTEASVKAFLIDTLAAGSVGQPGSISDMKPLGECMSNVQVQRIVAEPVLWRPTRSFPNVPWHQVRMLPSAKKSARIAKRLAHGLLTLFSVLRGVEYRIYVKTPKLQVGSNTGNKQKTPDELFLHRIVLCQMCHATAKIAPIWSFSLAPFGPFLHPGSTSSANFVLNEIWWSELLGCSGSSLCGTSFLQDSTLRQKDSDFASIWVTSNQILRLSHVCHPEVMVSKPFEKYPEKLFSTKCSGGAIKLSFRTQVPLWLRFLGWTPSVRWSAAPSR